MDSYDHARRIAHILEREQRRLAAYRMRAMNPIPPHLWPQDGPLGDGDLCLVIQPVELARIMALVISLELHDEDDAQATRIVHRDGSPWVEFDIAIGPKLAHPFPPPPTVVERYRIERFALWRHTLAVYRIEPDGSVGEDPVLAPELPV